jgi:hypothetical protein
MPTDTDVEVIVLLTDLLRNQIQDSTGDRLAEDQFRVYNQAVAIPEDDRDYFVVSFIRSRIYARGKTHLADGAFPVSQGVLMTEVQTQNTQETYTVSVFSAGDRARRNKEQVLFALNSDEAERLQYRFGFKIANLPEQFVDASAAEASRILNRYDISFNVLTSYTRTRSVQALVPGRFGVTINQ